MSLTVEQITDAIIKKVGNITEVAKALGVSRQSIYYHISQHPELQQATVDAREIFIDVAETALLKLVKRGNTAAVIFALKTQGKSRGYVERIEHRGSIEHVVKGYVNISPDDWPENPPDRSV